MEVAVEAAADRLRGIVRETPVLEAGELSRIAGAPVVLKAECLQLTGSFKVRGAHNKLAMLAPEELARGVVASSAGNHAQAVSLAAARSGARAVLYMPAGAPLAKVAAVKSYGGEVRLVPGAYDDAAAAALEAVDREGLTLVHPFDDLDVIAGQATVGVEMAAQVPGLTAAVVPLGGGGLVSGVASALKARIPGVRVTGVQAEARASGTICDGIAVKRPGEVTQKLIDRHVDEVVTVGDDEVAQAMVLLLERSKLVVEGAGAVGVAAVMGGRVRLGGKACVVLSGGNVDAGLLAECIRLGETAAGRRVVISAVVPDRPGALAGLLAIVAERGGNVVGVEHLREGLDLHVRETAVQLVLGTRGPEHSAQVEEAIREAGFRPPAAGGQA